MPEITTVKDFSDNTDLSRACRQLKIGSTVCIYLPGENPESNNTENTRSDAQNRLMWKWNGEIAQQTGNTSDWVHGESKMLLLNPELKVWGGKDAKRAEFFDEMCEQLTDYKYKVFAAYDNIRTKTLGVKKMAWYLTTFERHYAMQGLSLTRTDDYLWAIEDRRAA